MTWTVEKCLHLLISHDLKRSDGILVFITSAASTFILFKGLERKLLWFVYELSLCVWDMNDEDLLEYKHWNRISWSHFTPETKRDWCKAVKHQKWSDSKHTHVNIHVIRGFSSMCLSFRHSRGALERPLMPQVPERHVYYQTAHNIHFSKFMLWDMSERRVLLFQFKYYRRMTWRSGSG